MDLLWDVVRPGVTAYVQAWILTGILWVLTKGMED